MAMKRTMGMLALVAWSAMASAAWGEDQPAEQAGATSLTPVQQYAQSSGEGVVLLSGEAEVDGEVVRLCDVAVLTGDGAEALGGLVLAELGEKQSRLDIGAEQVRRKLIEAKVHWGKLSLRGYARCRVSRAGVEVGQEPVADSGAASANPTEPVDIDAMVTLKHRIEQMIRSQSPRMADQLHFEYAPQDASLLREIATDGKFLVTLVSNHVPGRVLVQVVRRDGEAFRDRHQVNVVVTRKLLAVVAARPIRRGEILTRENLRVEEVSLTSSTTDPVTQLDPLLGKAVKASLRSGSLVFAHQVEAPLLVKRGDIVSVYYSSDRLVIHLRGRALGDGALGEMIEVRREGSRETFVARVVSSDTVAVTAPTSPADALREAQQRGAKQDSGQQQASRGDR